MKDDLSEVLKTSKDKNNVKVDKTLYEKLLIIGETGVGKSSLIQNILSEDSIPSVSNSILSTNVTNNTNNDNANKTNDNLTENKKEINDKAENNEENNNNKNEVSKDNINDNNKNENNEKKDITNTSNNKDDKDNNEKNEDKSNNNKTEVEKSFISENKIIINGNKKIKELQVFESSYIDNNLIHSLAYISQCILVIFDIKDINSFEKAKQFINIIKSEIKIQKPKIILISTKNDNNIDNENEKKNNFIDNSLIMNFILEITQNSINDSDIPNDNIINKYIEISNNTKRGINELRTEILNSYEKEAIFIPPLILSSNQEYNNHKQKSNLNEILNNNNNNINQDKKQTSSTSTKSKSFKENSPHSNLYIRAYSPKILFKLEKDNKEKVKDILNYQDYQSQNYEKNFENKKIILLGDTMVGKTSFINRFFSEGFDPNLTSTIGINERTKIINYNETKYKIQIWDTAGQERFESIPRQYYEKMDGVFLFYDVTNEASFNNIIKWLKDIYASGNDNLIIYILGNKVDLIKERKISFDMGLNLYKQKNIKFMEISCKLDLNISEVVYCMIYDIIKIENNDKIECFSIGDFTSEKSNNNKKDINREYCCY